MVCFKCGEDDHNANRCPYGGRVCFKCKRAGHLAMECPQKQCTVCHGIGHSRDVCPTKICHKCSAPGHIASECEMPPEEARPGPWRRKCSKCGSRNHPPNVCGGDNNNAAPSWRSNMRPRSSEFSYDKPKKEKTCENCGSIWHTTWKCNARSKQDQRPPQSESKDVPSSNYSTSSSSDGNRTRSSSSTQDTEPEPSPDPEPDVPKPAPQPDTTPSSGYTSPPPSPKPRAPAENEIAAKHFGLQGNQAMKEENFANAIKCYTQAILLDDQNGVYYTNRAAAHIALKQYHLALTDCQKTVSLQGKDASSKSLTRLGRCHYALGAPVPALTALQQALSSDSENDMAINFQTKALKLSKYLQEFEAARSRNLWGAAEASYQSCLTAINNEKGEIPLDWRGWGIEVQIGRGKWDGAHNSAKAAVTDHPTSADLADLHALAAFLSGELIQANTNALDALRLDPDNHAAKSLRKRIKAVALLKNEGLSFTEQEMWTDAAEKYSEALKIIEENPREGHGGRIRAIVLSERAMAHEKLGRNKEAMIDIQASLKLNNLATSLRIRARLHGLGENYDAAIDDLTNAIELTTNETLKEELREDLSSVESQAEYARTLKHNHYVILGISRTCQEADIKKAFRRESLKHHPDKGGNAEKFKLVVAAYAVLSDPEQRAQYDSSLDEEDNGW